jgi:hypothetical protein
MQNDYDVTVLDIHKVMSIPSFDPSTVTLGCWVAQAGDRRLILVIYRRPGAPIEGRMLTERPDGAGLVALKGQGRIEPEAVAKARGFMAGFVERGTALAGSLGMVAPTVHERVGPMTAPELLDWLGTIGFQFAD